MKPHFAFKTPSTTGFAVRGRIEFSAGALSNRAQLYLDPTTPGEVKTLDEIEVDVVSFDPALNQAYSFPAFKGLISQLAPRGDHVFIEAVTHGSYLLSTVSKPRAWVNTTVRAVFMDLLASSKVSASVVRLPDGFGTGFLHVWETNGGTLADEVGDLLSSQLPGTETFSSFLGEVFVGNRDQLGDLLQLWPFPTDAAGSPVGRGVADPDASVFSLRPACPHQIVYNMDDRSFMGTVDSVVHEIRPGRTETTVTLDRRPNAALEAILRRYS